MPRQIDFFLKDSCASARSIMPVRGRNMFAIEAVEVLRMCFVKPLGCRYLKFRAATFHPRLRRAALERRDQISLFYEESQECRLEQQVEDLRGGFPSDRIPDTYVGRYRHRAVIWAECDPFCRVHGEQGRYQRQRNGVRLCQLERLHRHSGNDRSSEQR